MALLLSKCGTHAVLVHVGCNVGDKVGTEGKEQAPILKANEFIMIRTTRAKQKGNIQ